MNTMEDSTATVAPQARSVEAGRGLAWWTEAWPMFTKNAGMWIVLGLIMLVIFIVLGFIPFLGGIASALLAPVFVGGWLLAARKAEAGAALEVGDLFEGFKDKLMPLVVLGAVLLGFTIVVTLVVGMLGFGAVMGFGSGVNTGAGAAAAMGAGFIGLLVMLVLGFLVAMAFWYAPGLVVFRNVAPIDAMKASFSAGVKNIVPFLLYALIYIVAAVVASIPFGLGWIVLVPVLMLTVYVSYKDLFA
jgi:uncharacterized membrane protein